MTAIINSIHRFGNRFDLCAEGFAFHHPYLALLAMFIGMPVIILAAVALVTMAAMLPASLFFGWM